MAVLSNRQQLAKRLAVELDKMDGAFVTSPMPLDEQAKLRVQIKDMDKNRILQWLKDLGWNPVCISVLPRICNTGLIAACLYEIDLPRERQPIYDDRIQGELATKREMSVEEKGMRKALGLD